MFNAPDILVVREVQGVPLDALPLVEQRLVVEDDLSFYYWLFLALLLCGVIVVVFMLSRMTFHMS